MIPMHTIEIKKLITCTTVDMIRITVVLDLTKKRSILKPSTDHAKSCANDNIVLVFFYHSICTQTYLLLRMTLHYWQLIGLSLLWYLYYQWWWWVHAMTSLYHIELRAEGGWQTKMVGWQGRKIILYHVIQLFKIMIFVVDIHYLGGMLGVFIHIKHWSTKYPGSVKHVCLSLIW